MNPLLTIARSFSSMFEPRVKSREQWVGASVTTSELASAQYALKPGAEYIARLQGEVFIVASKKATLMNGAKIRLYRKGRGKTRLSPKTVKNLAKVVGKSAHATMDDGVEEVETSRGLELLRKPNEFESGTEANWLRFFGKQATGNAFLYYTDDQLFTLRPQFMNVIPSVGEEIIWGWRYGRETAKEVSIPAAEVLHFKYAPSIRDPFWGVGPLFGCVSDADLITNAKVSEAARWKNDGRPPVYANMPKEMNPDQVKGAIQTMREQTRGVRNAGNWLYGQATDVKPLGFAPKDMEYLSGQQVSREAIWDAFGIPHSIMRSNAASYAAAQAAMSQFSEMTIDPELCTDADQLTETHRRIGLIAENEFYAYDPTTMEDEAALSVVINSKVASGVLTLNEARAELGYDPYDDEFAGDLPRINGLPISHQPDPATLTLAVDSTMPALEGKTEPFVGGAEKIQETALNGAQVTALAGLATQVSQGLLPYETAINIARAAFPAIEEAVLLKIFGPIKNFTPPKEPDPTPAPGAKHRHKEKPADPDLTKFAAKMQAELESWLSQVAGKVADGVVELSSIEYAALEKIVTANMAEAYTLAANTQAGTNFMVHSQALEAVKQESSLIIERIGQKTQDDIRIAVSNGIEQGKGYAEIARDIEDSGYPTARAQTIAHTETSNALATGRHAGAVEAGMARKHWSLAGNPCTICESIYAKQAATDGVPINEPFATAGEFPGVDRDIYLNPAHPNCACAVTYSGDTND